MQSFSKIPRLLTSILNISFATRSLKNMFLIIDIAGGDEVCVQRRGSYKNEQLKDHYLKIWTKLWDI